MTEQLYFLTAEAIEDIKEISLWYEKQKILLGDEFINEVFVSIHVICKSPFSYFKFKKKTSVRRFMMNRFPYKIFYDSAVSPVHIIAVVHAARSSKYISKRLK